MAVWVLRNVVRWVLKECLVRDESAVSSCQAREVGYLGTVGPVQGGLSPHLCCISSWGQRPWKEEQCEAWWAERAVLSFPSESSQLCRLVEEGRWSLRSTAAGMGRLITEFSLCFLLALIVESITQLSEPSQDLSTFASWAVTMFRGTIGGK